jgi:hypothetical protein
MRLTKPVVNTRFYRVCTFEQHRIEDMIENVSGGREKPSEAKDERVPCDGGCDSHQVQVKMISAYCQSPVFRANCGGL